MEKITDKNKYDAHVLRKVGKAPGFVIRCILGDSQVTWARQPGVGSTLVRSSQQIGIDSDDTRMLIGNPQITHADAAKGTEELGNVLYQDTRHHVSLAHMLLKAELINNIKPRHAFDDEATPRRMEQGFVDSQAIPQRMLAEEPVLIPRRAII